ncbi:MAG: aminotransferase class III-fold pyridoxal phosphate-dependent enzyme [Rhodobacteraceae bacterium]|nr:aminotransferase class III-fold pyridoxal phosphate-dependent enzyme [Paracoccaceae bacterium]
MNLLSNKFPTKELQTRDAAHHMHPFTAQAELGEKGARIITRANGVFVYDSEGEEILDAMAGLWCVNIGYGRHELAEVAARQMKELSYYNTFFQTTHIPAIELAAKLAELAPYDLNHVFFASSGSEANDTNIRLVRHFWALKGKPNKSIIISRKNAYHGSSVGSGSLGGMTAMHDQGGMPIPDIHHINQPNWWSEGGDMTPEDFGLACARELEEKIKSLGADRSQTLNIKPDIMTIAKGLSSGYQPIGGSIVSDEIESIIAKDEFNHGYTYSSHPVAAAVALENLRIIDDENIIGHVKNDVGPYLKKAWEGLCNHPLVGEAKIVGMMGSIALTPNKETRAPFKSEAGTVGYICRERCFANNLIMRHVGDRMIISPPLIITKAEVDILIQRANRALDEAMEKIIQEGLMC